ncbi:unnamed protein product [Symbiodinium sp. CCMP2592]|nr:unnamed protein product [Symbiodinium sp. CCMP2592]
MPAPVAKPSQAPPAQPAAPPKAPPAQLAPVSQESFSPPAVTTPEDDDALERTLAEKEESTRLEEEKLRREASRLKVPFPPSKARPQEKAKRQEALEVRQRALELGRARLLAKAAAPLVLGPSDRQLQQEHDRRARVQELRRSGQERRAVEKAEKQKDDDHRRQQRKAEKLVQQTIKYCKDLLQSKVEKKKEVACNNIPDGAQILLRKEDRDEEFYCPPIKAKSGNKGKSKNKGSDPRPEKLTHSASIMRLFHQLNIDAPLSMDQVPGLLDELEKRLAELQSE